MSYWVAGSVAGSAVLGYVGSQQSAQAAQGAAGAQADQAAANRTAILGTADKYNQNITNLSQATPQELNILGQSYDASSKQLAQQQKLMDSIDPSLMEASKQALQILRGGTAASEQPIMAMRNSQRANLVNSLRAQYGPGAESSSIGQRALQQFDMQSQQMQQQTLGNLMGIASNPAPGQNLQRSISGLEEVGQGYAGLQTRQLNTQLNLMGQTMGALGGVSQQMLSTAGSQYVGASLQGQELSQLGNTGMRLGTTYAMSRDSSLNNPNNRPANTSSPL